MQHRLASVTTRSIVLALVAGLLAVVGSVTLRDEPASAALPAPILLSSTAARGPGVAVDQAGTAHIAWWESRPGGAVTVYCRLPRGATTCERREDLALADFQFGAIAVVLRDDGALYVMSHDGFTTTARGR